MGNELIKEEDITNKIAEIKKLNEDLALATEEFTTYVNSIQELIEGLKVCLDTTGGVAKISELSNIEFDTVTLNNIIEPIEKIQVTYNKIRKDL